MAPIAKKTYSRKNLELLNDSKNDSDPFDKLLSSPLKQDVDFKPLSYWRKNNVNTTPKYNSDSSPDSRKLKEQWKSLKKQNKIKYSTTSLPSRKNESVSTKSKCKKSLNEPYIKYLNKSSIHDSQISNSPETDKKIFKYVTTRKKHNKICPQNYLGLIYYDEPLNETSEDRLFVKNYEKPVQSSSHDLYKTYVVQQKYGSIKNDEYRDFNSSSLCNDSLVSSLNKTSNISEVPKENLCCNLSKTITSENEFGTIDKSLTTSLTLTSNGLGTETFTSPDDTFMFKFDCTPSQRSPAEYQEFDFSQLDFSDFMNNNSTIKHNIELNGVKCSNSVLNFLEEQSELSASNLTGLEDTVIDTSYDTVVPPRDKNSIETTFVEHSQISEITNQVSNMKISGRGKENKKKKSMELDPALISTENITRNSSNGALIDTTKSGTKLRKSIYKNVTTRRNFRNPGVNHVMELNKEAEATIRSSVLEKENIGTPQFHSTTIYEKKQPVNRESRKFEIRRSTRISDLSYLTGAASPMFESTRIFDHKVHEKACDLSGILETTFALKPGKQWMRSLSILKQLQNEESASRLLNNTNTIKGRHHQTLVEEICEMQEAIPENERTIIGNYSALHLSCHKTPRNVSTPLKDSPDSSTEDTESPDSGTSLLRSQHMRRKTIFGPTIKIMDPEMSFDSASAFISAFEFQNNLSVLKGRPNLTAARDIILAQCNQTDVLPFEEYFNEKTLKNCRKIGEGVFGEVFMCDNETVFKVIPIEGDQEVNGEPQKKFEEILSEVIIASKLSSLRLESKNQTAGFSKMKRCWCVVGKYPKFLLDLWNDYDSTGRGSENDSPQMFKSDQLYIVLELENGGKDLEAFVFNSAEQSLSILIQTAFTLAVAEKAFEFEHRDMHWGNLLVTRTKEKFMSVVLDGVKHDIPTKGVKVSIIDFTLSRILHEDCCLFNDLSVDPTLFASQGDYQFEIYRLMKAEVEDDWSRFRPKTNIFWLHYTIDKMLKMVRYKNKTTQVHKKFIKELKLLESTVLDYDSCADFAVVMGLV